MHPCKKERERIDHQEANSSPYTSRGTEFRVSLSERLIAAGKKRSRDLKAPRGGERKKAKRSPSSRIAVARGPLRDLDSHKEKEELLFAFSRGRKERGE